MSGQGSGGGGIIIIGANGARYTVNPGDDAHAMILELIAGRTPDAPPEEPCGETSTD